MTPYGYIIILNNVLNMHYTKKATCSFGSETCGAINEETWSCSSALLHAKNILVPPF